MYIVLFATAKTKCGGNTHTHTHNLRVYYVCAQKLSLILMHSAHSSSIHYFTHTHTHSHGLFILSSRCFACSVAAISLLLLLLLHNGIFILVFLFCYYELFVLTLIRNLKCNTHSEYKDIYVRIRALDSCPSVLYIHCMWTGCIPIDAARNRMQQTKRHAIHM